MATTFNASRRFQPLAPEGVRSRSRTRPETNSQAAARTVREPHFDLSLAGAGVAILLWMALFAGFLFSWFTMGKV